MLLHWACSCQLVSLRRSIEMKLDKSKLKVTHRETKTRVWATSESTRTFGTLASVSSTSPFVLTNGEVSKDRGIRALLPRPVQQQCG